MGACLLLAGMVAAIASAPLFDRVFTHHLAVSSKILLPFVAVGWFSLIWAGTYHCTPFLNLSSSDPLQSIIVRPDNTIALFIIMGVIGVCSLPMLAIGMELACEVTRNPDGSSAIIWFSYVHIYASSKYKISTALQRKPLRSCFCPK